LVNGCHLLHFALGANQNPRSIACFGRKGPTSENAVNAKFAERPFHALGGGYGLRSGGYAMWSSRTARGDLNRVTSASIHSAPWKRATLILLCPSSTK
jgi:hypothetical protein